MKISVLENCRIFFSAIFFLLFINSGIKAQEVLNDPIERILTESEGRIVIEVPGSILEPVLQNNIGKRGNNELKPGINKVSGYRIQVFSDGRNQNTLEARAKARGNAILAKFPKYKGQIYTFSHSPNWYTRVGNFKTSAEANASLSELKKAFPGFASEMRVVKSQIIIIKQ